MNLYIHPNQNPWDTWHVELQKLQHDKLKFTTKRDECDVHLIHWYGDIESFPDDDKPVLLYVDSIENFDHMVELCRSRKSMVLSDDYDVEDACNSFGLDFARWYKPTRVPKHMIMNVDRPTMYRSNCFTTTCNASNQKDNLPEIIKTYFSMCLYEGEDGELLNNVDYEIFSAQELPVEPFNNLRFNGLQPNPIMFKQIARSKLFISPYSGKGCSSNIVDAIYLGTPVLIRNTPWNKIHFVGLDTDCFFSDTKELAKAIKKFKAYSDEEIEEIAKRNIANFEDETIGYLANIVERL